MDAPKSRYARDKINPSPQDNSNQNEVVPAPKLRKKKNRKIVKKATTGIGGRERDVSHIRRTIQNKMRKVECYNDFETSEARTNYLLKNSIPLSDMKRWRKSYLG